MKEDYTELSLSVEEAIEKLKEYKEKTGKSQAKIAREMGVSEGVVSGFLSNTYKAMENIVPKVEQLLSITTKKEVAPREPGFKRTSVSTTVLNLIAYCHVSGKIGLVYGDAGVGNKEIQKAKPRHCCSNNHKPMLCNDDRRKRASRRGASCAGESKPKDTEGMYKEA